MEIFKWEFSGRLINWSAAALLICLAITLTAAQTDSDAETTTPSVLANGNSTDNSTAAPPPPATASPGENKLLIIILVVLFVLVLLIILIVLLVWCCRRRRKAKNKGKPVDNAAEEKQPLEVVEEPMEMQERPQTQAAPSPPPPEPEPPKEEPKGPPEDTSILGKLARELKKKVEEGEGQHVDDFLDRISRGRRDKNEEIKDTLKKSLPEEPAHHDYMGWVPTLRDCNMQELAVEMWDYISAHYGHKIEPW